MVFCLTYLIVITIYTRVFFNDIMLKFFLLFFFIFLNRNFFLALFEKSNEEPSADTYQNPTEIHAHVGLYIKSKVFFHGFKEIIPAIYKIKLNKEIPLDVPILMQKFSSTYYQKVKEIPSQIRNVLLSNYFLND